MFTAVVALVAGHITLAALPLAPLSYHMALHILIISLVARFAALALLEAPALREQASSGAQLFTALSAQIVVLWVLHVPDVLLAVTSSSLLHIAASATLLGVASWFWLAVAAQRDEDQWRAILGLLVSGKLICLLAALLIFAPRELYPVHMAHGAGAGLADQQLAGLLMIVACPLTYIAVAVRMTVGWIKLGGPNNPARPGM
jgi:putative membrane protein